MQQQLRSLEEIHEETVSLAEDARRTIERVTPTLDALEASLRRQDEVIKMLLHRPTQKDRE